MDKCFKINYNGCEIIMPKSGVNFYRGLGFINPIYSYKIDDELKFISLAGLVNEDYELVIDLVPLDYLNKLSIFDKHNIFVDYNDEFRGRMLCHVEICENEDIWYRLAFQDFEYIDEDLCRVILDFNGLRKEALYSVKEKDIISSLFDYIDAFGYNEEYGQVVALAYYILPDENNNFIQINTYINKKGEIIAPYFDVLHKKYYDKDMDISEIFRLVREDMSSLTR